MADGSERPELDFEEWYLGEHPRVLTALALVGGDVEIAREATDEAFVRAYERWGKVRLMASPGGWLYRVALNDLRRRFRRRTIERELLRRHHGPMEVAPPIAEPMLWDAVAGLPRRQRTAVALRYVLDLTEREVAETMGISRGAASATLSAARRTLEEALGEDVVDDQPSPHPSTLQSVETIGDRRRADDRRSPHHGHHDVAPAETTVADG